MWCRRVKKQISAFLDGELPTFEARFTERHLAQCERCRAERDEIQRLRALTGEIPEEDLPAGLHGRILRRLETAGARGGAARRVSYGPLVWTALAGATASVAMAYVKGVEPAPAERSPLAARDVPAGEIRPSRPDSIAHREVPPSSQAESIAVADPLPEAVPSGEALPNPAGPAGVGPLLGEPRDVPPAVCATESLRALSPSEQGSPGDTVPAAPLASPEGMMAMSPRMGMAAGEKMMPAAGSPVPAPAPVEPDPAQAGPHG